MLKPTLLFALLASAVPHLMAHATLKVAVVPTQSAGPQTPSPPQTAPPATDIYEVAFRSLDAIGAAKATAIASEPGYENQPFFTPDGSAILFAANRQGKGTDIYEFNRKTRGVSRLITTVESEYSPAITPDGSGVSVIRVEADGTQRLWRFDRAGANARLVLPKVQPVGYHAWLGDDHLALFVLGKPSTLQYARPSTGVARIVAENIGRSLHRIPDSQSASFVHRDGDGVWVKQFEPATGAITTLVRLPPGNAEHDIAWAPNGTLLMSAGTTIHAWRRGESGWREVFDVAAQSLGAITRMAAAPDGRSLAIVVAEPAR